MDQPTIPIKIKVNAHKISNHGKGHTWDIDITTIAQPTRPANNAAIPGGSNLGLFQAL